MSVLDSGKLPLLAASRLARTSRERAYPALSCSSSPFSNSSRLVRDRDGVERRLLGPRIASPSTRANLLSSRPLRSMAGSSRVDNRVSKRV